MTRQGVFALSGHKHSETEFFITIHLPNSGTILELNKRDLAQINQSEKLTVEEIKRMIGSWYIIHLVNTGATEHNAEILAEDIYEAQEKKAGR